MRQGILITLSVTALALGACGQKTETANNTSVIADNDTAITAPKAAAAMSPGQTFANTAAASDAFEIATSKLAATNAKSPAVKAFATKMIAAHTESTDKLKAAAARVSPAMTPDPTLTAEQQAKVDDLTSKTGGAFDTAYATAQTDGHQATLDALKSYSAGGDVPELKTFATGMVPIVAAHLNMAKGLKP